MLKTIRVYHSASEAAVAKSFLDAHGIVAFVQDWHVTNNAWHYINALQGIRLDVVDSDAAIAGRLLDDTAKDDEQRRPVRLSSLLFAFAALFLCSLPHDVRRRR